MSKWIYKVFQVTFVKLCLWLRWWLTAQTITNDNETNDQTPVMIDTATSNGVAMEFPYYGGAYSIDLDKTA